MTVAAFPSAGCEVGAIGTERIPEVVGIARPVGADDRSGRGSTAMTVAATPAKEALGTASALGFARHGAILRGL
ncbi:MAG: hypothetical protein ACK501_01000, partial [Planctomycetota bacterium]